MIRRTQGDDWLLITQHDHALLAGELAEHFGNGRFAKADPFDATIKGVRLHDAGWPLHDDEAPTLNPRGEPLDVFEVPRAIALRVWQMSADRAAAQDAYAGLLTSLHVLSLSVFATTETEFEHEKFDMDDPQTKFGVTRFQHHEIERQEMLRSKLGLRTDRPVLHGVRHGGQKPEDKLVFNKSLLQAMDLISLAACCTTPPAPHTKDVYTSPGGDAVKLELERRGNDVHVDPWPFDTDEIALQIPASRLPAKPFADEASFHAALKKAPAEVLVVHVRPR
jgi:hypothetical protein